MIGAKAKNEIKTMSNFSLFPLTSQVNKRQRSSAQGDLANYTL